MVDETEQLPESLLPYDAWMEAAMRQVMVRALQHAASEGLPGGHHFYLTYRTDFPGVSLPARLRAQYPEEMTIVIQHQFWDLVVDEAAGLLSIGLSFGGVPATLRIPFAAITAFADPFVRHGMRFRVDLPDVTPEIAAEPEPEPPAADVPADETVDEHQVVSLDAFRRRPPPKS
jgi:hypothetical protein